MDAEPDAGIVQQGRDHCSLDHFDVGDAYEFRHQEGGGAHDRRHQLASRGGGGFYGTGKGRTVAQFLHHGDGEGTGAGHVGHRGAGYGAHEAGGEHGHFGGTAHGPTGQCVGKVDEELAQAGGIQISSEQDEQEDEGGGDPHGDPEDPFGGEVQMAHQFVKGDPSVGQDPRHIGT